MKNIFTKCQLSILSITILSLGLVAVFVPTETLLSAPVPDDKARTVKLDNPLGDDPDSKDINSVIAQVIKSVLGIIGALALVAFVVGGVRWLTSAGSEEKVTKGTHSMLYAAIGIIVIFTSYAILKTIMSGF